MTANKFIATLLVVVFVLCLSSYVLYEKTVSLKDANQLLTESLNKAAEANKSLEIEIKASGKVSDITNQLSDEVSAAVKVIQQTSRDNQYVIRQSLKAQPCAIVKLPADVYRVLNPKNADTKQSGSANSTK